VVTASAALDEVFAACAGAYPLEACGVVIRRPDGSLRVRPMQNASRRALGRDPRRAYAMDPHEQLAVFRDAERQRERIEVIFHSHCDAGAHFSEDDREQAAPDGQPLHPGTSYLVVSIEGGRATGARMYRWEAGELRETPVRM
jgi:proteasome lid subunit RPN8/RPN11